MLSFHNTSEFSSDMLRLFSHISVVARFFLNCINSIFIDINLGIVLAFDHEN